MIITHAAVLVNTKKYENWTMKKELNTKMAEKMKAAGLPGRAKRISECSDKIEITFCPECGKYEITKAKLCRDRLCPVCSWRLSIKRYADMTTVCSALLRDFPESRWSFMTLTVKNCAPELLDETLSKMAAAFNRMRQRTVFLKKIAGWARTVEVTFNKETNELHPHYHVLIMWQPDADPLHDGARLLNQWLGSCRDLLVSQKAQHIEDITGEAVETAAADITGAVLETFKYTQKSTDLLSMPTGIFYQFALNMARKRAVSFGGIIKEYLRKHHIKMDDEPENMQPFSICKNCGNSALSAALYKWSFSERSYLLDTSAAVMPEEE